MNRAQFEHWKQQQDTLKNPTMLGGQSAISPKGEHILELPGARFQIIWAVDPTHLDSNGYQKAYIISYEFGFQDNVSNPGPGQWAPVRLDLQSSNSTFNNKPLADGYQCIAMQEGFTPDGYMLLRPVRPNTTAKNSWMTATTPAIYGGGTTSFGSNALRLTFAGSNTGSYNSGDIQLSASSGDNTINIGQGGDYFFGGNIVFGLNTIGSAFTPITQSTIGVGLTAAGFGGPFTITFCTGEVEQWNMGSSGGSPSPYNPTKCFAWGVTSTILSNTNFTIGISSSPWGYQLTAGEVTVLRIN